METKRDNKGRFIKGNVPWSKSKKGVSLNTGRTHFKKGFKWSEAVKNKMKDRIPWNKDMKMPPVFGIKISKTRKISSKTPRGENHPNWIEDRSLLKTYGGSEERRSPKSKEWTRRVKNRDWWKCKINNKDCSGKIKAHHILSWRDYSELRYNINNGITLCQFHHPLKRVEEQKLIPFFQEMVEVKELF